MRAGLMAIAVVGALVTGCVTNSGGVSSLRQAARAPSQQYATDWILSAETDPITDEEQKTIHIMNEDGYSLTLYRVGGGPAFLMFLIPYRSNSYIEEDGIFLIRVDKYEAHIHGAIRGALSPWVPDPYVWKPDSVNILVWYGEEENEGLGDFLGQLMNSRRIVVRYAVQGGSTKDVFFRYRPPGDLLVDGLSINMADVQKYNSGPRRVVGDLIREKVLWCMGKSPRDQLECADQSFSCRREFGWARLIETRACLDKID